MASTVNPTPGTFLTVAEVWDIPNEADRRKAIGRVKRFIGCGTGPFRFCTFAFSPSSGDQEGYKGVGWTLWAWQMNKIYIWARFLKDWSFGFLKL